jgi:hypothetical protein
VNTELPHLQFLYSAIGKIKRHHREKKGDANKEQKIQRSQRFPSPEIKKYPWRQSNDPEKKHKADEYLSDNSEHRQM